MDKQNVSCERKNGQLIFYISGSFDYKSGVQLKNLANKELELGREKEYVIDLKNVRYINSSVFGAMIILKEIFGATSESFSLINASPEVLKMLKTVHFHTLFNIR
ncbi:MAG: STAS domain-containing protein [Magnetococcales bacterium]|nr:STAS domain-containing protein [Magnetococcales bacterium]